MSASREQADTCLASLSSAERRLLQRAALRLRHLLVAAVDADALVQEPQQQALAGFFKRKAAAVALDMASHLFCIRALPARRLHALAVAAREADREKIAGVFVLAVGLEHPLAPVVKAGAADQEGDAGDALPWVFAQVLCVIGAC